MMCVCICFIGQSIMHVLHAESLDETLIPVGLPIRRALYTTNRL